eukprot:Gb_09738 [translate_table: standard]
MALEEDVMKASLAVNVCASLQVGWLAPYIMREKLPVMVAQLTISTNMPYQSIATVILSVGIYIIEDRSHFSVNQEPDGSTQGSHIDDCFCEEDNWSKSIDAGE